MPRVPGHRTTPRRSPGFRRRHGMLAGVRQVTRREVMGLAAVLGLSACTGGGQGADSPTIDSSATPEPDRALASEVAAAEWALVAAYDRALAAQPGLTDLISPLRDQHREHAAAMGSTTPPDASAPAESVGTSADQVLADLLAAERAAVTQRTAACDAATQSDFASLVALIAASEAGHVEYLRGSTA